MSIDKKLCFDEKEFMVIAGSLGIERMYGFTANVSAVKSRKECAEAVLSALGKGFLYPDMNEDIYYVTDEVREIFDGIRDCTNILIVSSAGGIFEQKCLFCNGKVTVLEAGNSKNIYVKGCCDTKEHIAAWLAEGDVFMPGAADDNHGTEYRELEKTEELQEKVVNTWELKGESLIKALAGEGLTTVVEKLVGSEYRYTKRLLLFEGMVEDIVVLQEAGVVRMWAYSKLLVEKLLLDLIGQPG